MRPASLVAWRCASSKYAGTVTTASVTGSPRYVSAISFILASTIAEISGGEMSRPCTLDPGVAVGRRDDAVGRELDLLLDLGRVELAAHQALDREDGVLRVGHRLALGDLPDQPLAARREADDRRRGARPFGVGNDLDVGRRTRMRHLDDGDARVGGPQIDPDDLPHACALNNAPSANSTH